MAADMRVELLTAVGTARYGLPNIFCYKFSPNFLNGRIDEERACRKPEAELVAQALTADPYLPIEIFRVSGRI